MGKQANQFLASFNRIEKWLQDEYKRKPFPGFAELVRRLSKRKDLQVRKYHDDLLEIAQLRNAIVHDRIAPDFVIAEPNDWIVKKIEKIEQELIAPELVSPRFKKEVVTFEKGTSLDVILKSLTEKEYSQFPIYDGKQFLGLITANGIGIWLAAHNQNEQISIKGKTVESVLKSDAKRNNYLFVAQNAYVFQVMEKFLADPTIEAILITTDGQANSKLIGLVRPKEVFQDYYEEWSEMQ
ncbi:CBS domain-containing protein [Vagococcus coleopterorum]|uniref:CBS domain-containing protein n=1 Tax=Vagococcus coleopterorum TaxID=2714946 RepID=A0A6G8ANJ0_9ENTE|nr:CBS domain-containing protein [Vagococcus coleopterorum]QIL46493.1 CBS domain-containing protein [Vagococcus coleopterorum]